MQHKLTPIDEVPKEFKELLQPREGLPEAEIHNFIDPLKRNKKEYRVVQMGKYSKTYQIFTYWPNGGKVNFSSALAK